MKKAVHYFKDLKADSTNRVLSLIRERAELGDISKIVVASTTGSTASAALEELGDEYKLVVVPHQFDFSEKDSNRFPEELTRRLREKGHSVHFGTMLFIRINYSAIIHRRWRLIFCEHSEKGRKSVLKLH